MRCARKNSLQGLDIDKMVHLAMERCFVGEMIYLTFRLSNTSEFSPLVQTNLLPVAKATRYNRPWKIPELLANGLCRVQNEVKQKSIADVLAEYIRDYEENVLLKSWRFTSECSIEDCSDALIPNNENRVSIDLADSELHKAVSPSKLVSASASENIFVLSMDSTGSESINCEHGVLQDLSSEFTNMRRYSRFESDSTSESSKPGITHARNENVTLVNLKQSFRYTPETNHPYIWTSLNDEPSQSLPEVVASKFVFSNVLAEKDNPEQLHTPTLPVGSRSKSWEVKTDSGSCRAVSSKNINSLEQGKDVKPRHVFTELSSTANCLEEFDFFDSPTYEDLDAFLATMSSSLFSMKPERIDKSLNQSVHNKCERCPRQEKISSSNSNTISCYSEPTEFLTSTPSLANRSDSKACELGARNFNFSPICYAENVPFEVKPSEKNNKTYDVNEGLFLRIGKQQSVPSLSSTPVSHIKCVSNCPHASKSRRTPYEKSLLKSSPRIKEKPTSKNLSKIIVSSTNTFLSSNNSQLKNTLDDSIRVDTFLEKFNDESGEVERDELQKFTASSQLSSAHDSPLLFFP